MLAAAKLPPRAFREIDVAKIDFSDIDVRSRTAEKGLDELGDSMANFGILEPILVSFDSQADRYRVIIGGRRVRAAVRKKLLKLPASIVDDITDATALTAMLIENMQRSDLDPLEEAQGMAEMRDRWKYSEADIAHALKLREQFVGERLALLQLPDAIRAMVAEGTLGVGQAVSITRLEGRPMTQLAIANDAQARQLSAQIVERMVAEARHSKRRYKRMTRKHKLKKQGPPLSEGLMDRKIQQIALRGEQFISMLDGLPLQRWNPAKAQKLHGAMNAIEQGLSLFRRRVAKRMRETE